MAGLNEHKRVDMTVDSARDGERLDRVIAGIPGVGSRAGAQRLIAAGLVTAGGAARAKNYRVHAGEGVTVLVPPPAPPGLEPEEIDLSIPYEDEHLLVVDKPAGLVTHPARGHATGTLVHGLLGRQIAGGEHPQRPGIVHRLDRDTSGLLIVARDEETHRRLTRMLTERRIKRTYVALVHGLFETSTGTIEAPVGRDASQRKKMAVAYGAGRDAVTHFRVVKSWPGRGGAGVPAGETGEGGGEREGRERGGAEVEEGLTLLEISLETGRTHQIRVHLAAIGHPVAGDRVYGRRRDVLGIGRQFLHAAKLAFKHPVTGENIEVEAPLPPDLEAALRRLG